MLVVETIAKIRRAHFVDGKPIKQICRELKLSRKVVRKVLRSEATAFEYKRSVQPHPKLGAWREELERLEVQDHNKRHAACFWHGVEELPERLDPAC